MDYVFWVCLLVLQPNVRAHFNSFRNTCECTFLTDTIVDSLTHSLEENISFNI